MASAWSQLDQLLTCAICLDRYRNPKLLPCQHTFCMEPCLDGLIDYARRQIKCPECRGEHRIPYQGIQQFPTNVTLMRFLELHRDITGEEPEPPPSMMERCNVCSEKSNVEKCAHCEKKICPDCKEAHVDILRREINRINNQVRRGLHRLSEALTQTKKNAEKLQVNCKQVNEEIDDIVKRYSKDLKVTEEKLKHDLEVYTQNEMKAITKLKEDLEVEVNNISSNCDLVDKYIKDDYEWSDVELLEYKQIFLKMLDFLRTFDPDNTDFARRIKFQPRADPDVLHKNIADFGELKINAPMNQVPTQQSLMPPTSNALMRSQSDHRLAAQFARRCNNTYSDTNQRMDSDRPTSPLSRRNRDSDGYRRYSERARDYEYSDRVSSRYSRDDTAFSSRWREGAEDLGHRSRHSREYEEGDSEPHSGRTVRFADEPQQKDRIFDTDSSAKGPLSGVMKLVDSPKVMERLHQNEVKIKQNQSQDKAPESQQSPAPITTATTTTLKKQTSRQASEDDIDRQKRANQQSTSSATPASNDTGTSPAPRRGSITSTETNSPSNASESTDSPDFNRNRRRLSGTTSLDQSTNEPSRSPSRFSRPPLVKATSLDTGESSRKLLEKKASVRAATPIRHEEDESEESDEEEEVYETAKEPPKPVQSSFFSRQRRLPDPEPRLLEMHEEGSEENSEESDEDEEEEDQATATVHPGNATKTKDTSESEESDEEEEDEESTESSSTESESGDEADRLFTNRNNASESVSSYDKGSTNSKSQLSEESDEEDGTQEHSDQENAEVEKFNSKTYTDSLQRRKTSNDSTLTSNLRSRKRSDDTDATDSSSASSSNNYPIQDDDTSRTAANPADDRVSTACNNNDASSRRFRRRPFLARSKSSHEIGLGIDANDYEDEDEETPESTPNYKSQSQKSAASDYSRTRSTSIDAPSSNNSNSCWARYLNNKYGSKATERIVPRSRSSHSLYQKSESESSDEEISGKDSSLGSNYALSSPRSTYMQKRKMQLKIGSRGSESGQFAWPRGVAVGPDNSIVVADSGNNRIQVFSARGDFSFAFGSYGSGEGEFDCPVGVSVNRIGQLIVSDRYNHRVQLFDPTGRFLRAFGCEGRTDGRFTCPWGIATDSLGFIYVCDKENHRIQVFQSDGTFVGKFGGGPGGRPGQLEHPHSVAVTHTNRVVVSDSHNHRLQVFDVNGRSLASFGSEGAADGRFKFPRGVAVDDQGFVAAADAGNNRVQVFSPDGSFLRAFGGWGGGDGDFRGVEGLAVTSSGSIVACDRENHRVQIF